MSMKSKTQELKLSSARKKVNPKSSKESLEDIFEETLKDIYWAEKLLIKTLPKLTKASSSDELQQAFTTHLEETKNQIVRIEKCFELMEKKAIGKKCEAMEGLVKEGQEAIDNHDKGHARDAAIIAAAQKVEHYEMSAYGTLRTMATVLGKTQCAEMLEETKNEEVEADLKLTTLAEKINYLAAEIEHEEEVEA